MVAKQYGDFFFEVSGSIPDNNLVIHFYLALTGVPPLVAGACSVFAQTSIHLACWQDLFALVQSCKDHDWCSGKYLTLIRLPYRLKLAAA